MKRIPILATMRRTPFVAAIIAIAAGCALAFALPAGATVSQLSPPVAAIQIASPAHLGARGAVVTVPITVVCGPNGTIFGSVRVTQRAGSEIANGFGSVENISCTGTFQTINATVNANPGKAFKRGKAFASAELFICNNFGCAEPAPGGRDLRRPRPARRAALRPRPLSAARPRITNRPHPVDRRVTT